jgi:hypothetical protein
MSTSASKRRNVADRQRRAVVALSALVGGAVLTLLPLASAEAATPAILLGTGDSFAVLAGTGITNTGATSVTGDIGTHPAPAETGFGSITQAGVNHVDDAVTQQAKDDLTTAYDQAAGSTPTTAVAVELGGRTLTPGVYGNGTLEITGTLTLDTLGDPRAVFVFQAATTLTTATDSTVVVVGGGEACNVFWQIGSSATLGTRSHLVGSVLALTSITATTGATVQGRLLARNGAVTLDHNTLTRASCTGTTSTTGVPASTTLPATGGTTGGTTGGPAATTPTGGAPDAQGPGPTASTIPEAGVAPPPTNAASPPRTSRTPAPSTSTPAPTGSGPPRLPYTGVDVTGLAVGGIALIAIGAITRYGTHRRPTPGDG